MQTSNSLSASFEPSTKKHNLSFKVHSESLLIKDLANAVANNNLDAFEKMLTSNPTLLQVKFEITFNTSIDDTKLYINTLHLLAYCNFVEGMKYIIEYSNSKGLAVDLNIQTSCSSTPLILAAKYGYTEMVKLLLDNGADVNTTNDEGMSPLTLATSISNADIAEDLILRKPYIDWTKDEYHYYVILWAISKGYNNILHGLIENGANVNWIDEDNGHNLLMEAVKAGNTDAISLLLTKGANVNQSAFNGNTPMHIAHFQGNIGVIKILINHKADLNKVNDEGMTPLHGLLKNTKITVKDKLALIKEFLDLYDISKADNSGKTVIDYAKDHCPQAYAILNYKLEINGFPEKSEIDFNTLNNELYKDIIIEVYSPNEDTILDQYKHDDHKVTLTVITDIIHGNGFDS